MTGYPKFHKDPMKVRPVISNCNAPHSRSSKFAARTLSNYVGILSDAHIRSTRDFAEKMRSCRAKGRLLSLDVKSLYPNVPLEEALEVIREHSTGSNPTFTNLPLQPELFCQLLEVCMSFNQFTFAGNYYRQVTGCPIGCSLSSVIANIYLEHFETTLMDAIPADMRPSLYLRYVDDIIMIMEDMDKFDTFLHLLNAIRPTIQFTFELSRVDKIVSGQPDLPENVLELIPFLELNVMRLENGEFAFSIYRKACHGGMYIHAYSYQPIDQKRMVIRNMFLRAYRYCGQQFLKDELLRVKEDFSKLGYSQKFIEKCRSSAFKGRRNELRNVESTTSERSKPLATLALPYHPSMKKVKPRLSEMGVRLVYTSNSSLGRQLKIKSSVREQPTGCVYVANCVSCPLVYIGQTGRDVHARMGEHSRGPQSVGVEGAITKHNRLDGHQIDLNNPTEVFKSDDYYTRVTVEAALIHSAPTIADNTATASVQNRELVEPVICRSAKFNWKKLSECIPSLKKEAIHHRKRRLFGNHEIVRAPSSQRSQPPATPVGHRTRRGLQLRASQGTHVINT